MPRSREGFPSDEKLLEYIESVELAVSFIKTNSAQRIRLSFLLLHNVSELLMHSLVEAWIADDEFQSLVMPPEFTKDHKKQARRDYAEKLKLMVARQVLLPSEAAMLKTAHPYRNAAYHRDDHNPDALQALAWLLLSPVETLFRFGGRSRGSSRTPEP